MRGLRRGEGFGQGLHVGLLLRELRERGLGLGGLRGTVGLAFAGLTFTGFAFAGFRIGGLCVGGGTVGFLASGLTFGLRGFEALLRLRHLADGGFQIILCQLLGSLLRRLLRLGDGLRLRLGFGLLAERGGNLLLLLLERLLQTSGLVQLGQRLIHLLLRGGDGFGSLRELRGVVRGRLAEFVGELLLLLVHGGLGGLEVGHGLCLVGTGGGGIGLLQVSLGGGHVFLRGVEGAGGFGGNFLRVGLGGIGLRSDLALLFGSLRGGLVVGLLGGLGGVGGDLLLVLHNLADFLAELVELGEVLLGLL